MEIVQRRTDELIPYERNQKKHDDKQIRNVANSIKRFGWQQPIVVDSKDVVIIGHCRLLAAKMLGMEEVPVTVAENLTEDEVRELRIADNKTNESEWDFEALELDAAELEFDGFDFDLSDPFNDNGGDSNVDEETHASMSDTYLVPPFSVLYANKKEWLDRKKAWVAIGLRSDVGRGENLTFAGNVQHYKDKYGV